MSVELTNEQKAAVLSEWNNRPDNPPSLLELIRVAYPDKEYDGRTKEGRAVKKFLATRQIVADGAHVYKPKDKIGLTEEHKEYISNNAGMMSSVEIARIIFNIFQLRKTRYSLSLNGNFSSPRRAEMVTKGNIT